MQFIVRYWSSALPAEFRRADGSIHMLDYSVHPPSRLGLHNAMLARNDRVEILETYGGSFQCEVYVVEGANSYVLTQDMAIRLFNTLPSGEVKWITIREFMLPNSQSVHGHLSHEQQLHLFEYAHASDVVTALHHLDMDA